MGSFLHALLSRKQRWIGVQCLQTCKENAKEIVWMDGWGCCMHCCFLFALHPEARQESSKHCIALGSASHSLFLNPVCEKRVHAIASRPEKDACMVGWRITKGENLNCR